MDGFLLVDKPEGISTFDVIRDLRRRMPKRTKLGHGGTLDPFASGLVIVLVGKATRLMPWVVGHDKRYVLTVRLGVRSDTDDRTGTIERTGRPMPLTADVELAAFNVSRLTEQVPPAVSALHVDGERAYRRVRRGETVELPSRPVRYDEVRVLRYDANAPGGGLVDLDIRCASGTYMRSFARDLGYDLGIGAVAEELRRVEVGPWRIDEAVPLEEAGEGMMLPMSRLVPGLPQVALDPPEAARFVHGQAIAVDSLRVPSAFEPAAELAVTALDGTLLGIARLGRSEERDTRVVRPHAVLAPPAASADAVGEPS